MALVHCSVSVLGLCTVQRAALCLLESKGLVMFLQMSDFLSEQALTRPRKKIFGEVLH